MYMRKVYFHNEKSIDQNINTKRLSEAQQVSEKQVVDINKLLNRVKIDQKNETKRKIGQIGHIGKNGKGR